MYKECKEKLPCDCTQVIMHRSAEWSSDEPATKRRCTMNHSPPPPSDMEESACCPLVADPDEDFYELMDASSAGDSSNDQPMILFACSTCGESFETNNDFDQHCKQCRHLNGESSSAGTQCPHCRQQCYSEQQLSSHIAEVHDKCSYCEYSGNDIDEHVKQKHMQNKCEGCANDSCSECKPLCKVCAIELSGKLDVHKDRTCMNCRTEFSSHAHLGSSESTDVPIS